MTWRSEDPTPSISPQNEAEHFAIRKEVCPIEESENKESFENKVRKKKEEEEEEGCLCLDIKAATFLPMCTQERYRGELLRGFNHHAEA